ncbi:major facilitator superfamily domain-containing protein 10 [Lepeophtheirus salmonis]|nr:major facilitator superfamily domain-containing protein 10-like [Lepeophtheirus salmonis]XP_040566041.1 major facilitator superfamily domain-containing protein 10-like [Lepeophtheirus salmonis]XP_040566042.1 major facilitator superfamily domain-containing protein 10-like [Lepeophtheirus salmonis]XP_040566044.1 major facilitator superfamily domain-containing protein 10-like [Lepeophtheirus salmonis]
MEPSSSSKSGFKIIFISLLLDLLAFTLILPLFPSLLEYYRKNNDDFYSLLNENIRYLGSKLGSPEEFNSVLFGGCLGSLFSFLQFISSPIMGSLSDHYGRRPLLLVSTIGIALSYCVWICAGSFKLFILARVIGGLSKGNISLSTAVVTDISNNKTRAKGMAMIGIAFSIGFILGPCIGAGFSYWAKNRVGAWYVYPALCALLFSIADVLFLYFNFEETLTKRETDLKKSIRQALTYINPLSLFRFESLKNDLNENDYSCLKSLGAVNFLYLFLYSGLEFTLTFLTHIRFNFTSMQQGKMFLFVGVIMALIQGGYVRRIPPGKEKSTVLKGLLLIVPSFAIVGLSRSIPVLYIGLGLYSVSTALVVPCLATLVSQHGDANQKGVVLGVYRSLGALGRAVGPIFASILYWAVGPELCYCFGGLGLLIPYIILKRVTIKPKKMASE